MVFLIIFTENFLVDYIKKKKGSALIMLSEIIHTFNELFIAILFIYLVTMISAIQIIKLLVKGFSILFIKFMRILALNLASSKIIHKTRKTYHL
jgi:hypothetical protein